MKEFGEKVIQLNSDLLRPANVSQAVKSMSARSGRIVVQMQPTPKRSGLILLPDTLNIDHRLRPDIAQVICADPELPIKPGDHVVVNHAHGAHIEGFKAGNYQSAYETRIYGVTKCTGTNIPVKLAWHSSILGICNTVKYPVYKVVQGEMIPICKRRSSKVYESFIYIPSIDVLECEMSIGSPLGDGNKAKSILPTNKTLRVIVDANTFDATLDIRAEVVSSEYLESVDLLDGKPPFRATGARVLVELPELHDVTPGGLMMTERESFRNTWCDVLSVGGLVPPEVNPGMKVLVRAEGLQYDKCFRVKELNPDGRALRLVHFEFIDLFLNADEAIPA